MVASEQARAFIRNTVLEPLGPFAPGLIDAMRASARTQFIPRAKRAIEKNQVVVENRAYGGVPCFIMSPPEITNARTILYFFGGGYIAGSGYEDAAIAAPLARATGSVVVVPEYRQAPEHPFPAATDDGIAVYRALLDEMQTGELVLAGESAGGNLALVTVLDALANNIRLPASLSLFSPWCDLTNDGESVSFNDGRDPTLGKDFLDLAARLYADGADVTSPKISPLYDRFDDRFPPTIITTGSRDLLLSQCIRLAQTLRRSGVPAELRVWDELWHVFEYYDELPEAASSIGEVAAFIRRHGGSA